MKHVVKCAKCLYRMSSLSVDYILTLVLAILLAVKYVLFDPDENDAAATVATVTTSATTAAVNGPVVKSCFGDGQLEQINEVPDEALHCESAEDITPTASSLAAGVS